MKLLLSIILLFLFVNEGFTQENKNRIGEKIYGDFNGDGKFEYAFRVLIKKGKGNPVEDGTSDVYEIQFSDKNIKPIKDDFNWFVLINEGDLNKDGSDEISVREDPLNGCIGYVKTFTIKNGKSYYLFDGFSFYNGACDNEISIEPQDLVEASNGSIYYYEYNPDVEYSINSSGKKIKNVKKIKVLGIKTVVDKPNISKNVNDALSSISGHKGGDGIGSVSEHSLENRKTISKSQPAYNCQEQGRVVVQVTVDRSGNVIKAIAGIQGSTNFAKCLLDASEIAAKNTKWEPDENAPEKQVGKINYNFSLK